MNTHGSARRSRTPSARLRRITSIFASSCWNTMMLPMISEKSSTSSATIYCAPEISPKLSRICDWTWWKAYSEAISRLIRLKNNGGFPSWNSHCRMNLESCCQCRNGWMTTTRLMMEPYWKKLLSISSRNIRSKSTC